MENKPRIWLIVLTILFVVGIVGYSMTFGSRKYKAYKASKEYVGMMVKNPATLKFPSYFSDDIKITQNGDEFTVVGECTAKSDFGVDKRIRFSMVLIMTSFGDCVVKSQDVSQID